MRHLNLLIPVVMSTLLIAACDAGGLLVAHGAGGGTSTDPSDGGPEASPDDGHYCNRPTVADGAVTPMTCESDCDCVEGTSCVPCCIVALGGEPFFDCGNITPGCWFVPICTPL